MKMKDIDTLAKQLLIKPEELIMSNEEIIQDTLEEIVRLAILGIAMNEAEVLLNDVFSK